MEGDEKNTKKKRRGPYGRKQIENKNLQEIPEKVLREYDEEQCLGYAANDKVSDHPVQFQTVFHKDVSTPSAVDGTTCQEHHNNNGATATLSKPNEENTSIVHDGQDQGNEFVNFCDDDFILPPSDDGSNFTMLGDIEELTAQYDHDEEEDLFNFIPEEETNTFDSEAIGDKDSQPLFEGARVTTGAFMLLLALFTSKHRISGDGIHQLLQIISLVLPFEHNLSVNLQGYRDFFKNLRNPLQKHYYCPNCLGTIDHPMISVCTHTACQKEISGNLPYFLEIPVIEQLRSKFKQSGFYEQLQGRFKRTLGTKYEDIYDGKLYMDQFLNNGPLSCPNNISFVFNTDGASVFKSNNTSIWPIFMVINELPYKIRMMRENMILAGLWFGRQKPIMSTFLKPLKESMIDLWNGIKIDCSDIGSFVCRGILLAGTADLPARSLLCNSVQFNGDFGCWKCRQKGKTAKVGKGHTHVFPFCDHDPKGPYRTTENVVEAAQEIVKQKQMKKNIVHVNGVKGPSWLLLFPSFSIINGIAIDYMHGVMLGVQKLLLRLWFDKSFAGKPFNFQNCIQTVDEKLACIQPTSEISRLPRSIDDLKYWKASEFRSFLLYYGGPVLQSVLDDTYFYHYLKFVQAIFLLLKFGSTPNEVNHAEILLQNFCKEFSNLYDECYMTLNVHQLLHLPDSVRNLGPLYTHSCFPFEDMNGFLLKTIRGTQNIDSQIITGISFVQKLPELKEKCILKGTFEHSLCISIENPHLLKRGKQICENVFILGSVKRKKLDDECFSALTNHLGVAPHTDTFLSFNRVELGQQLIYGLEYARMIRRDNSTVLYDTGSVKGFCQVLFFCEIEIDENIEMIAFAKELRCQNYAENANILRVSRTNIVNIVPVKHIVSSCMLVDTKSNRNSCFVCLIPNKLECD